MSQLRGVASLDTLWKASASVFAADAAMNQIFQDLLLTENGTIIDAMRLLNENGREVVLIQNSNGRITGLITDGDIRRGLVAGLTLESSVCKVMKREFHSVAPELDRAAVLDVMRARTFQHLPVLDSERRLIGIHFLRDLVGATPKPNIAVVMAGGKGVRLRPITESVPKPMVEIAGRPMLERIVLHLIGHGIREIFLAVNYKAEIIEDYFGDGRSLGCKIEYLRETQPLGTGGPLALLPSVPEHPFLVMNGDQVTRIDLSAMLDAHCNNSCAATMAVGPFQVRVPFGSVTENQGRLVGLDEKPTISLLVNRGIYTLEPSVLKHVPPNCEFPITTLFENLLQAGEPIGLFHFDDYWLDVGMPDDLRRANGLR